MTTKTAEPLHELAKFECQARLFYFLSDLGVKSADEAAKNACNLYLQMLTDIMSSEQ